MWTVTKRRSRKPRMAANGPCETGTRPVFIAHREDGQWLNAVIAEVFIWDRVIDIDEMNLAMNTIGGLAVRTGRETVNHLGQHKTSMDGFERGGQKTRPFFFPFKPLFSFRSRIEFEPTRHNVVVRLLRIASDEGSHVRLVVSEPDGFPPLLRPIDLRPMDQAITEENDIPCHCRNRDRINEIRVENLSVGRCGAVPSPVMCSRWSLLMAYPGQLVGQPLSNGASSRWTRQSTKSSPSCG